MLFSVKKRPSNDSVSTPLTKYAQWYADTGNFPVYIIRICISITFNFHANISIYSKYIIHDNQRLAIHLHLKCNFYLSSLSIFIIFSILLVSFISNIAFAISMASSISHTRLSSFDSLPSICWNMIFLSKIYWWLYIYMYLENNCP